MSVNNTISELEAVYSKEKVNTPFQNIRSIGWDAFVKNGWPTRRNEDYKFTPLDTLVSKNFSFENASTQAAFDENYITSRFFDVKGYHLVFVNGAFDSANSIIPEEVGVSVRSFDSLNEEELATKLGRLGDARPVVAINQAFLQNGLLINIASKKQALPFFIYHFLDTRAGNTMSFPRLVIDAADNSEVRFNERTFEEGENAHFSSMVSEIFTGANASVRMTKLQQYKPTTRVVDNVFVRQVRDSRTYFNTFSISGGLIRNNLEIEIAGEHAEANLYGLYLLDGKTHVDNHTIVDHQQPNSESNELYKGILDGASTGVFNGRIFVRQDAQKTNAFQSNNNISLSDSATLHTKPQLEIWADDVKCSHGCTSGQIDQEALFYLKSRGLSESLAKAMLLNAFAEETLKHVELEQVKEEVSSLIHQRLDA